MAKKCAVCGKATARPRIIDYGDLNKVYCSHACFRNKGKKKGKKKKGGR
jgi:hypothetical protein